MPLHPRPTQTCNVQRLPPKPWVLLEETLDKNLQVFNGLVITCVVAGLSWGIAKPCSGWGVNVEDVRGFGPAVGVGV